MMQEKGLEGYKNPNQPSKKHDRADEKEEVIPFKKRSRFLASNDIKEASQLENTITNKDKQIISSTSGQTEALKENKTEIFPIEKIPSSTTYDKDAVAATLSLLAMRQSRCKLSIATSAVKKDCMKKSSGDKNPVEDDVSRKIHIGDGSRSQPQGDGGSHEDAPGVGDSKQVIETKEIIEHEGGGGNQGKEESNKGKQTVEYIVSTIVLDGNLDCSVDKTPCVGEHGKQVHEVDPVTNVEESNSRSPGDATLIEKDGGIRKGDAVPEEGQVDAMDDGDNENKKNYQFGGEKGSNEGKKLVDTEINVYDRKQAHEAEPVTNVVGSSRHSPFDTATETKNDGYSEGGFHEQGQVVAMEDVGGDENIRNNERVDDVVSTMIHDGGSGGGGMSLVVDEGEQVNIAEPVTNHEGNSCHSLVDTTIENMNDGNSLEDNHEKEQHIPMDDVGDGSGGINATLGEEQDKKGKRPIEYVECTIIQDGAGGSGGKELESNDNNAPIVSGDREQLELELAELLTIPILIEKERESGNSAPHVGGEGGVRGVPPTNLPLGRSSDAIHKGNHDDQIHQAALEVPDGGNENDIAIPRGYISAQGGGEIIMLDPLIIRNRNPSIHELGEVSQPRPIVSRKTKHGCDGGVGCSEPSVQHANNHRLRLFGVDIPHVEEHEEVEIMQQPKPIYVLRLLGVDIVVPEEEVHAAATEIKEEGSSGNHVQGGHGGGELSIQQDKYGLRLMGFDL